MEPGIGIEPIDDVIPSDIRNVVLVLGGGIEPPSPRYQRGVLNHSTNRAYYSNSFSSICQGQKK